MSAKFVGYGPKFSFIQTYWPWYLVPKIHVATDLTKDVRPFAHSWFLPE